MFVRSLDYTAFNSAACDASYTRLDPTPESCECQNQHLPSIYSERCEFTQTQSLLKPA